jgi:hypothetical protein
MGTWKSWSAKTGQSLLSSSKLVSIFTQVFYTYAYYRVVFGDNQIRVYEDLFETGKSRLKDGLDITSILQLDIETLLCDLMKKDIENVTTDSYTKMLRQIGLGE